LKKFDQFDNWISVILIKGLIKMTKISGQHE